MSLSCWSFLLGALLSIGGAFVLFASELSARCLKAFPRCRWLGMVLTVIAWLWAAWATTQMGLDFLEPYKRFAWVIAVVCIPLTWWVLDNLLPCRAWGGILCLFPYSLLHVARVHDSPWRLALTIFAYFCIVKGMIQLLYPWKQRQWLEWAMATPSRFRLFGIGNLLVGVFFVVLGATVLR